MCLYHALFIHSFIDGHLGCFHLLAVVTDPAMNMSIQMSLEDPVFSCFGYTHRSGIARSYDSSIFEFILDLSHKSLFYVLFMAAFVLQL